ncbi:thioesterase family protein [Aquisalimonas sp.]|uniref:acyl-CoA thioesterase n=1 Tax=Aquisalimonas sp. TaxID=1872621 RepID=UPI0025BD70B7|nr:acyl-ACP thioesterase [Aquisalimonas sp.]
MIELYRNSVQSWEIDMMGHMNVKFYVEKSTAALAVLGHYLGLGPDYTRNTGARLIPVDHHIRFLHEQRSGAPIVIRGGVVAAEAGGIRLYQEMVNAASGAIAATFTLTATLQHAGSREARPIPEAARQRAEALRMPVPEHGAARGLQLTPPRQAPTLSEADDLGMLATWQGPVLPRMGDADGFLATDAHMGTVSDAIPNLLVHLTAEDRSDSSLGGAALEYRFVYRQPARTGDLLALRSGIKEVGTKTYQFGHWLFDIGTGEAVATAEAVAVMLDLSARKAVVIPAERRSVLERHIIPGLSA